MPRKSVFSIFKDHISCLLNDVSWRHTLSTSWLFIISNTVYLWCKFEALLSQSLRFMKQFSLLSVCRSAPSPASSRKIGITFHALSLVVAGMVSPPPNVHILWSQRCRQEYFYLSTLAVAAHIVLNHTDHVVPCLIPASLHVYDTVQSCHAL